MKKITIILSSIVFCFSQNNTPTIAGKWNLTAFNATYDRKVVTGSGIEHSADLYKLVATWDHATALAAAVGADPAFMINATNQILMTWAAGDNAPGYPSITTLNSEALTAYGIALQTEFYDAPSNDKTGTYQVTGIFPSIRLNPETCTSYLALSSIFDWGDYTLTFAGADGSGTIAIAPETSIEQVLPPFPDGKFTLDNDAKKLTINYLDRDSHSSRYSEVMANWSEANDRVISGISQLPIHTTGEYFTTFEDPDAGDLVSNAYIAHPNYALWGGYLTWYAFNILGQMQSQIVDVNNPLNDLDGDGTIGVNDMVIYMHADNLAAGGGKTQFGGIPYTKLVDSSNPTTPVVVNDSATDFELQGFALNGSGGKMKYTINPICIPVDETIELTLEYSLIYSKPEISTMQDLTINEDESSTVTISATDADGDVLTYSAVSDTNAVTVSVSGSILTITPNADWNGVADIKAYVSDEVSTDSTSFKLTVTAVSDIASVQDVTIDEDQTTDVTLSATFAGTTTFTAVSDTSAVTASVSSTTLTLTPNANWHGEATITAYASDGSSIDSTSFKLMVTPMQDAPMAFEWVSTATDTINITKDNLSSTYDLDWTESVDVDGDTINYIVYAKIGQYRSEEIFDSTATNYSIPYQEIAEGAFEGLPGNTATVYFSVWAHDETDSVKISRDDRVLYVNRYEYLSIESEGIPVEFALHENYPNPFNPTTQIRFDLPEMTNATLTIYNMIGQKIKSFNMQSAPAGYHSLTWDATNDLGAPVAAGVYLYQLQTKGFIKTKKMILLK